MPVVHDVQKAKLLKPDAESGYSDLKQVAQLVQGRPPVEVDPARRVQQERLRHEKATHELVRLGIAPARSVPSPAKHAADALLQARNRRLFRSLAMDVHLPMPGLMAQNGVVQTKRLLYERVSTLVEDDRPGLEDQLGQNVLARPFVDRLPKYTKVKDVLNDPLDQARAARQARRTPARSD